MLEWVSFFTELFRSGQGIPFLAIIVVCVLSLYLFGLFLTIVFPFWRRYRNLNQ